MQKSIFEYAGLIARFLKGKLSPTESESLEKWLNEDKENRKLLESFRDNESVQKDLDFFSSVDVDQAWQKVAVKTQHKANRILPLLSGCAAAILLIILYFVSDPWSRLKSPDAVSSAVLIKNDIAPGNNMASLRMADGSVIKLDTVAKSVREKDGTLIAIRDGQLKYMAANTNNDDSSVLTNELRTPAGGTYQMLLPDGSKVWVNSLSSLKFPTKFSGKERLVVLTGEAYFEVAHDRSMPFKVLVNGTEVEVLGTHFNISAYGNAVRTSLAEGAVRVTKLGLQRSITPGEQAVAEGGNIAVSAANIDKALAWKDGMFWFEEDNMGEIMEQVARWYNVEISYRGEASPKRFTGNVRRQAKLSQVLQMLNLVSGAGFEIDGRKVIVNFNK